MFSDDASSTIMPSSYLHISFHFLQAHLYVEEVSKELNYLQLTF